MSRFRSSLAATIVAGTLLVVGGCADVTSAPSFAGLEKIAAPASPARSLSGDAASSAIIGPRGGELATTSGHRIVFPAGAVPRATEISIRDDGAYLGVRLEPHGLQFPAGRGPVLTLNLNGAATAGYDELHIVYVNDASDVLEVLPTAVEHGFATTRLRHFSGYITAGN
jgi:hypothetical protein